MTQSLYLLRHAKAEPWSPGINDFHRDLNTRGEQHMRALVDWAGNHLQRPDVILCSGSLRTRKTVAPFLEEWTELAAKTQFLDELYEASAGALHAMAEIAFEKFNTVMMVGHNPGLEAMFLAVTQKRDTTGIYKMPTGALAVIEFDEGYSDSAGNGRLRHWTLRKDL